MAGPEEERPAEDRPAEPEEETPDATAEIQPTIVRSPLLERRVLGGAPCCIFLLQSEI